MPCVTAALRFPEIQYPLKEIRLDRENVLSLALVALQFKADLTHSLAAFAGPDLVLLLALGSSFGTSLLMHFLLAANTLLLETFDNVDSATPFEGSFAGGVGFIFHVVELETVHAADLEATGTGQGGCVGERSRTGAESDAQWARRRSNGRRRGATSVGWRGHAGASQERARWGRRLAE